MSFSKFTKKWSWIILLLIYITFIAIYAYKGIVSTVIGLALATITLLYNKWETLRRWIHYAWYWIIKMQFEWTFIVSLEASVDSVYKVDEVTIKKWIGEILDEANLKNRKKDVIVSKQNSKTVIYISPIGLNLTIDKYKCDDDWHDNPKARIHITGHSLINFRQTRKMLQLFLKMFFNSLEGFLVDITDKKYTLQVLSGEMDSNFYKNQFIKGFDEVDQFKICKKTDGYVININERMLEIISSYKEDIINNAKHHLLMFR